MKNWFNTFFGITKREYNGLLLLMAILLILTIGPHFYKRFLLKPSAATPKDLAAVNRLLLIEENRPSISTHYNKTAGSRAIRVDPIYAKFDPNTATSGQWQLFGLSHKQATSILNYVKKGGRFYRPTDLRKMYTISAQKYAQLEPYIEIGLAAVQRSNKNNPYPPTTKEKLVVEINAADTLELDKLKGIGASFAKRIVKYRDRLGGFYSKTQLLEVFGLDSAKFLEVVDQVTLDLSLIKKIDINSADLEQLRHHPYLKFKEINAILQYRKQHGNFESIDDLKKVLILNPQTIQSLAPYLLFNVRI